jgi:transposase
VFVDEMGVAANLTRLYGRSQSGHQVVQAVASPHQQRVSVMGAMAVAGVRKLLTCDDAVNGEIFEIFIDELVPELESGDVVVMDNVAFHKRASLKEKLEAVGAKALFLSPYSPDFNPIENLWSKLKSLMRGIGGSTREMIEAALNKAFALVTAADIKGWFAHCGYLSAPN